MSIATEQTIIPAAEQLTNIEHIFQHKHPDQYIDFLANKEKIQRILQLKQEKNVLILGHNYMAPLIYNLSGEGQRGDSLQLAQFAAKSTQPIILFDGVRFMAETAKILNPSKKVLIADFNAGCSLADPCRAEEVREYKKQFPGLPVVIYINSYADAKAESDYCCTSSNGLKVVQHAATEFGTDKVIFLPDSLMGENIQDELHEAGSTLELIYPGKYDNKHGSCEVHERISLEMVQMIRQQFNLPKHRQEVNYQQRERVQEPKAINKNLEKEHLKNGIQHSEDRVQHPETAVLVHWECLPEVRKEADFCGSTSQMIRYVKEHPSLKRVYLGTECEMTANLQAEYPQIDFVRACAVACQHMAKITLDKVLQTLETEQPEVTVPENIRLRALVPIERMLKIK